MKRRERKKKWRGRWVVRLPDGSGGAYRFRSKRRAKGYAREIGGTFGRFHRARWSSSGTPIDTETSPWVAIVNEGIAWRHIPNLVRTLAIGDIAP